jgi:hypothetical protein
VALDAVAVYRATKLLQQDDIPPLPRIREKLMQRYGASPWSALLDCPWCLSIWVAGGAVAFRRVAPRVWRVLARVLASSAVAGVISEALEHMEPDEIVKVLNEATETVEAVTATLREVTERVGD